MRVLAAAIITVWSVAAVSVGRAQWADDEAWVASQLDIGDVAGLSLEELLNVEIGIASARPAHHA